MENEEILRWPNPIKGDPSIRNRNLYCRFHKDHGHDTEDCKNLKREVDSLISRGYLKDYIRGSGKEGNYNSNRNQTWGRNLPPKENSPDQTRETRDLNPRKESLTTEGAPPSYGVINTIAGGIAGGGESSNKRKKYANKEIRHGDLPKKSRTCFNVQFSDKDMETVELPHDDPIVISSYISNYLVRRILVDTGSSADIITSHTFNILKRESTQLEPIKTPLIGFGGNEVEAIGRVRLEVMLGEFPKCAIQEVDFLIVDLPHFAYNAIFGRPSLQKFKAVVAPYCLSVKFPVLEGEGIVRSEQKTARECYLNSMRAVEIKKSKVGDPTKQPLGTNYEYSIKLEKEDSSSSDDEQRTSLKKVHKKQKHIYMLEL